MARLVPGFSSSSSSSELAAAAEEGQQPSLLLPSLLWQLQQLLLSPAHQLPSLQQQVLQVVSEFAAHKQPALLQCMVRQGWVQVLWSFLPGGRQLLAVTLSQLIQQQQQQQPQQGISSQVQQGAASAQQLQQQVQPLMQNPRSLSIHIRSQGQQLAAAPAAAAGRVAALTGADSAALQALAHLCSWPSAAAVAVQLQASYQAAALSGMLAVRATQRALARTSPHQQLQPQAQCSGVACSGAVWRKHGQPKSWSRALRQRQGGAGCSVASGPGCVSERLFPAQSPKVLPNTPLSSSGGSSSAEGSYVAVAGLPLSSSLGTSSGGGSAGSGGSGSMMRSSSSGLLSRLGMGRSGEQQRARAAAAASGSGKVATAGEAVAAAAKQVAAAGEPVEDPGSPVQMLVTLLGEQWAATAAAELLARFAAAAPASCLPAMLEQGVVGTLAECMAEIQPNNAGAVAALATLLLVQQLGRHCPEQLHAAGIVAAVLRMLKFECGDAAAAAPVRAAALQVLAVLCGEDGHADRLLCAAVAQSALLQLVRWLGSSADTAAAAAAASALTGLLECGAVDATALAALQDNEQRSELLSRCLMCLQFSSIQQQQGEADALQGGAGSCAGQQQQQQQQQGVQVTAVRLLRAFVELDGCMVEAFLAADGLVQVVAILSAAVAAGGVISSSVGAVERREQLVLQYELLAVLDSLSLVHRRVLVQAAIVPIIVGVLRQHLPRQDQQQPASKEGYVAAAAGQASLAAPNKASLGDGSPATAAGGPVPATAATQRRQQQVQQLLLLLALALWPAAGSAARACRGAAAGPWRCCWRVYVGHA
ncbi:hypothetical protein COO60DRAFT_931623 [Scenedesmus sp. NREL 46B-D3]|nr:hypothetical protein COO60DRAFT_931623 [Scenedesmus sp. NREL 46B-D3]